MKVVVVGGGMIGLCSAMLLGKDGHEVTVLDRDPGPPAAPTAAWADWERRGLNQARLAHLFLCRFREFLDDELPELAADLDAAGACRLNIVGAIPEEMRGALEPSDDRFVILSGRRVVVEAVTAARAQETKGVTVRRGVVVRTLVTGVSDATVPHVTGVELDSGEQIMADVVIDAGGRRSALSRWLVDIGAAPYAEESEDSGFTYYGRHFQSEDGSIPPAFGPYKQDYGSISVLTLPADNGTWSVTLVGAAGDTALRALRDTDVFTRVVGTLPLAAHWLDGEPIEDKVATFSKIEDRIRDLSPGGSPVVTGILSVGDAWACTNPSLGRGVSMGALHAAALRDVLGSDSTHSPAELASAWGAATAERVEPWYRTTLRYDRNRLAEVSALIDGRPFSTEDEEWQLTKALERTAFDDPGKLRALVSLVMCLKRPDEIFSDQAFAEQIVAQATVKSDNEILGPDRSELLATIAGA